MVKDNAFRVSYNPWKSENPIIVQTITDLFGSSYILPNNKVVIVGKGDWVVKTMDPFCSARVGSNHIFVNLFELLIVKKKSFMFNFLI